MERGRAGVNGFVALLLALLLRRAAVLRRGRAVLFAAALLARGEADLPVAVERHVDPRPLDRHRSLVGDAQRLLHRIDRIVDRLGLGDTLGYLVAGALVGPQLLGLVGGAESKMRIAELGIVLLLFLVGLELNPSRLWRMKGDIFGLGALQVVLCGLALAAILWALAGFSPAAKPAPF